RRAGAPGPAVRLDVVDPPVAGGLRAGRAGDRVDLQIRAGRRAGVRVDHARIDSGDGALAADLARVQVLRRELHVVYRDLRLDRRRDRADVVVLRVGAGGPGRRGAERRDRARVAVR